METNLLDNADGDDMNYLGHTSIPHGLMLNATPEGNDLGPLRPRDR
jgi:hypothetical protein